MLERKQVCLDANGEAIMADYVLDGNLYFKVVENKKTIFQPLMCTQGFGKRAKAYRTDLDRRSL